MADLQLRDQLLHALLPSFVGVKLQEINFNDAVCAYFASCSTIGSSDKLNYRIHQMIIDKLYPVQDNVRVYGGWMENRQYVWKGTYMDKDKRYIHLGVDATVSAGNFVNSPLEGTIEDIFNDPDTDVGWGGRIILNPFDDKLPLLILAHLEPKISREKGDAIKQGEFIGKIGTSLLNGGVWEHLHIQALPREVVKRNGFDYQKLDGYGVVGDLLLERDNPNPLSFDWH